MSTIQDWPVSQRRIQYKTSQSVKDGYNTRPSSQSKVGIIQDWPVSQRWIQYTTSRSVYNEIHIQYRAGQSMHDGYNTDWPVSSRWIQYSLASRSTMRFIFNTGLASQFMMGTTQSGQSVKDGYNK